MPNIYHILQHKPAIAREDMLVGAENLADRLVQSGLLRIDAFERINFARFYRPYESINLTFSHRELNDPKLLFNTRNAIEQVLRISSSKKNLSSEIDSEINKLQAELKRYQFTEYELEIKLARLLVQANHPVIIELAIVENVEIYISYSYNIGDVLDVVTYQKAGQNGGMQSTDGRKAAIFISCGGDPFAKEEVEDAEYGNGFPALARFMVIAGQELGHFADLIRDTKGNYISRHASNLYGTSAKLKMKKARLHDIERVNRIEILLKNIGLSKLVQIENHVKINRQYKKYDLEVAAYFVKMHFFNALFKLRCRFRRLQFYKTLPKSKYLGNQIILFLQDQKFNASPKADVYRNEDKKIEETIACIEALARVPQQVNKWGHYAVRSLWPKIYRLYYHDVISSCITAFEQKTSQKYKINVKPADKLRSLYALFKPRRKFFRHF